MELRVEVRESRGPWIDAVGIFRTLARTTPCLSDLHFQGPLRIKGLNDSVQQRLPHLSTFILPTPWLECPEVLGLFQNPRPMRIILQYEAGKTGLAKIARLCKLMSALFRNAALGTRPTCKAPLMHEIWFEPTCSKDSMSPKEETIAASIIAQLLRSTGNLYRLSAHSMEEGHWLNGVQLSYDEIVFGNGFVIDYSSLLPSESSRKNLISMLKRLSPDLVQEMDGVKNLARPSCADQTRSITSVGY